MTDKSIDAFRTISEVAEDLNLPQHVLRFWETRFAQIRPMKRGGGRRYYRPDDVELLKGIRYLLYVKGFTIKGVQRILKESGNRFVIAIGSGDLSGLEQIQAGRAALTEPDDADEPHIADFELITDELPSPPERTATDGPRPRGGIASLLRRERTDDLGPKLGLPADTAATLQDVVMELLECKRLLDQVR
ncbi:MAG: MerR family transcriptional regulator [Rhizobiaceae bacterium]|nr:MerR family transcriptional regulator [Rhizobiaceae bacterium]